MSHPTPPHHKQKKTPKNAEQTLSHQLFADRNLPPPPILAWDLRQPTPPRCATKRTLCAHDGATKGLQLSSHVPRAGARMELSQHGFSGGSGWLVGGGWCCWVGGWVGGWLGGLGGWFSEVELLRCMSPPNQKTPREGCKDGQGCSKTWSLQWHVLAALGNKPKFWETSLLDKFVSRRKPTFCIKWKAMNLWIIQKCHNICTQ